MGIRSYSLHVHVLIKWSGGRGSDPKTFDLILNGITHCTVGMHTHTCSLCPSNIHVCWLHVAAYSESNTTHLMLMDLRLTLLSSSRTRTQFMWPSCTAMWRAGGRKGGEWVRSEWERERERERERDREREMSVHVCLCAHCGTLTHTVVSRASAHSRVSTHVPNFKGSLLQLPYKYMEFISRVSAHVGQNRALC